MEHACRVGLIYYLLLLNIRCVKMVTSRNERRMSTMADKKDITKKDTEEKQFPGWRILSAAKFAEAYAEGCRNGQRFCFILGSGASVESGIPTGGSLEYSWMKCLMGEGEDEGTSPMSVDETRGFAEKLRQGNMLQHDFSDIEAEWENAKAEGRNTLSSEFYFDIYKLRFYPNNRNGYRYLEHLMEHAEPSFGYHPLAKLLTDKYNNNLVVTTNFDSLVEDALFLYTDQKPLAINHELTADYIGDHSIKRPIIAKLHRGLFFDPLNDPEETTDLKGNWKKVLREIFHIYTPIVIGYGGGDQSLMKFLEEKELDLPKGIYWCYMDKYGFPTDNICDFLKKKEGFLVQMEGFDHIMLVLGNKMCPDQITSGKTIEYLEDQMNRRMKRYSEQIRKLEEKGMKEGTGKLNEEVEEFSKNEEEDRKERKERDEMTAFDYYIEGMRLDTNGEFEKAVESYTKSIKLYSRDSEVYLHRAQAYEGLGKYSEAIEDYNRACEINPKDEFSFYYRAELYAKMGKFDKALVDYSEAVRLNPNDVVNYGCRGDVYAELGDYDNALEDYNRAISIAPKRWVAYYSRSKVYRKLGMTKEAEEDEKMYKKLRVS